VPAPRRLLVLLVAAALVAGCGRESSEEQVRSSLDRFAQATAEKDFQTLCDDVFATKLVEEVRRSVACELALKNSSLGEAEKPKLEILSVKVDGDRATADVRSSAANQPASQDTVELIREGDEWRIISLSSDGGGSE
jgi:Putative lumazine-binding